MNPDEFDRHMAEYRVRHTSISSGCIFMALYIIAFLYTPDWIPWVCRQIVRLGSTP